MGDPFDLQRFVDAQAGVHDQALREIRAGRKTSHWMWFVFPQLRGLGNSPTAVFYGLASLDEARVYLAHPLLGPRLRECAAAAAGLKSTARAVFGTPDDLKLRSSLTLFEAAAPDEPVFGQALDVLCDGVRDPRTQERIGRPA
jgi:uncharacterized protein (DUF1810 family)